MFYYLMFNLVIGYLQSTTLRYLTYIFHIPPVKLNPDCVDFFKEELSPVSYLSISKVSHEAMQVGGVSNGCEDDVLGCV